MAFGFFIHLIKDAFKKIPLFMIGYLIYLVIELSLYGKPIYIGHKMYQYGVIYMYSTFGLYYLIMKIFDSVFLSIIICPIIYGLLFQIPYMIYLHKMNPEKKRKIIEKRQFKQNQKIWNQMSPEQQRRYYEKQQKEFLMQQIKEITENQQIQNEEIRKMREETLLKLLNASKDTTNASAQKIDISKMFVGVSTKDELKKRYMSLLKIYHPDNQTGDTVMTQKIKIEYEFLCKNYE